MGMYDNVLPEINILVNKCPKCKHKFNINEQEWQTKSYKNLLFNVSLRTLNNEVKNFEAHTICENCGTYIKLRHFENNETTIEYQNSKDELFCKRLDKNQMELFEAFTKYQEGLTFDLGGLKNEDL